MPEPKGRGSAVWPWFVLVLGSASTAFGSYFAFKWVTTDEPDVYGTCSRGSGSCLEGGETLNMVFTLVWGGMGSVAVICGIVMVLRRRRRSAADAALLASGLHADAIIVDAQQRGMVTKTNGRVTGQGYLLTLDPQDGGPPLTMKVTLPPGARVRVAYDPSTRDAVLLEEPGPPVLGGVFVTT